MYRTAKGKRWYFGMNPHIGVGNQVKIIDAIKASAANVPDMLVLQHLLRGQKMRVWGSGLSWPC